MFAVIWAMVTTVFLIVHTRRNITFTMAVSKFSDCVSDIFLVVTICLFGAVSTALCTDVMRIPVYMLAGGHLVRAAFAPSLSNMLLLMTAVFLHLLFAASAVYLGGTLVSISKTFYIIIPSLIAILFAISLNPYSPFANLTFKTAGGHTTMNLIGLCFNFYLGEHSIIIFAVKILCSAIVMLAAGTLIIKRMEVKK